MGPWGLLPIAQIESVSLLRERKQLDRSDAEGEHEGRSNESQRSEAGPELVTRGGDPSQDVKPCCQEGEECERWESLQEDERRRDRQRDHAPGALPIDRHLDRPEEGGDEGADLALGECG